MDMEYWKQLYHSEAGHIRGKYSNITVKIGFKHKNKLALNSILTFLE